MDYDELELDTLGDEKSALFFIMSTRIPPSTFWLPSLFRRCSTFYVNGLTTPMAGVCPTMCGCCMQRSNTGQVPGLEKIVAVIRSREISLTLFYQAIASARHCTKTIPKPSWETWTVSCSLEAGRLPP